MKAGDLVKYRWPSFLGPMHESFCKGIGVVVEGPRFWEDPNSDGRNVGCTVLVSWPDGTLGTHEDDELEVVNHDKG